jgi:hypothetical protein
MDNNIDPITFEILKIAKEIVINEYTDLRAEQHNKWLIESEYLWKTQRLRLAYPPIPPYPNEKDIVFRASLLLEFVKKKDVYQDTLNNDNLKVKVVENIKVSENEKSVEDTSTDFQEETTELVKEQPKLEATSSKRILPTVLDKLTEMKKSFRS